METDLLSCFEKIQNIETNIRGIINQPRIQDKIIQRPSSWNKLTASLDCLGDTTLAIESYAQLDLEKVSDYGIYYLIIYGVMQTLLIQQDAARFIYHALFEQDRKKIKDIILRRFPDLEEIRQIRNKSVGHPCSDKKEHQQQINGYINRNSIEKYRFELTTIYSDDENFGEENIQPVDIMEVVVSQQKQLVDVLEIIENELKEMVISFKKSMSQQEIFPLFEKQKIDYPLRKIKELSCTGTQQEQLMVHLKTVLIFLSLLEKKLKERGDWSIYEHLEQEFSLVSFAVCKLSEGLDFTNSQIVEDKEKLIYGDFLVRRIEDIRRMIRDLDEELRSEDFF